MDDADKSKEQLIKELERLRQQIAQLQASEADYKKAEEEYRLLIENAAESICVAQDNKIELANPKSTELTGYTIEELTSISPIDIIHPDDRDMVMDYYSRRLKGESLPGAYVFRIIDKGGDIKWLERNVTAITWEGRPAALVFDTDVTERKRMEEYILESEAKYRELAESITDVFFAMDEKLRYTYWNKASEELLGISAKDALGKSIYDIVPDDESTRRAVNAYRRALVTKEPQHFVNERSLGGRDYVFDISAYPTKGGLCVYVKDITERRKLEKALEESEQYYRHIFDNAPFGIGFSSIDGKVITLNKAMEAITGYSAEDFTTINLADIYVDRADREILLQEIRKRGDVVDYPAQLRRKDGTIYDALLAIRLTTIGDKEFVQTICHDITERKRAEESLKESEERYRALVELSPEAIFVASEGRHVFTNSAGLKLFGASSPDQIVGKSVMEFIHPDYREIVAERIRKALETGMVSPAVEEKFLRLDGTDVDVEVRAAPLIYQGKQAMQAVVRDISERKKAEETLRLSEQNFRDSIENSPLGIRIVNEDGKTLYTNRAFLDMYGYSSLAELETVARRQRYTAESYNEHDERIRKRKRGEDTPSNYEISIVRKDGQVRELAVSRSEVRWNGERQFQVIYQDITERKQAEEALRQREEHFRALIEHSSDVVTIIDSLGTVKYQSPNYKTVWGRDSVGEIGRDLFKDVHPDDMALVSEKFNYLLVNPASSTHIEIRARHENGSWRTIDVVGRNLIDHPAVRGIVVNFRDITGRKRAEEQLQLEKERAQRYLDIAGVILIANDAKGRVSMINKKGCEVLGYEQEEIIGKNWFDTLIPETVRKEVKAVFKKLMAGEVEPVAYFENPVLTKNGEERIIAWNNVILKDGAGNIVGTLSSGEDVTQRKEAEEALRASETRYRLLAENVRDVIWATDMDLRFTYVSPSVKYLGDRTAEEVMSMSLGQLLTPSSQELAMKTFAEELVMANVKPFDPNRSRTLEVEFVRPDGSILWAELKMNFIRGPDGLPAGILGVMRDITERRMAEDERRALEQKAQLASRLASIGELASGIAHEINNPLTGVIGYAELLMQEDVPEHVKNDLEVIHDGAQRVAGIVKGLLKFARQTKPERTLVNINEIIEVTLRLKAYELETSNIKVINKLAPDLPLTVADAGQLQQVFLNLLINAEREMRLAHGKGRLIIQTEYLDNNIRISFKDNGPGIANKNLERIFDPFFTTREVGEGTGLGLSICHGIVTEHRGRIWAESRLGSGATFIVELPVIAKEKHLKHLKTPGKQHKMTKGRILVVDDELVVRQLITEVLTADGHEVETTADGKDALRRIKGNGYDLILVDMKLPGMSGSELYEKIQIISKSLAERVVFITGDIMAADTEAFLFRTGATFIAKPFNIKQLKSEIRRLLATYNQTGTVKSNKNRKLKAKI
jgi:PAS domain S-box-containing protein